MDISVIIPTYNRAHTLKRALDSVLQQTLQPREILVVDDASTDATAEVLQPYLERIELVRLARNRGVSHARNVGIRRSCGEWIALLDSDDAWLPQKLERQATLASMDPTTRAVHADERWIRDGHRVNPKQRHRKPRGRVYRQCLPLCCVSPSAVVLHREVFERCGGFDESLPACEDYDLWLRVFSRYDLALVDEPMVVKYGGHEDQLSRRFWGMDRFRVRALAKMLDSNELEPEERELTRQMLHAKCRVLINGAIKRGNSELAGRCRRLLEKYPASIA